LEHGRHNMIENTHLHRLDARHGGEQHQRCRREVDKLDFHFSSSYSVPSLFHRLVVRVQQRQQHSNVIDCLFWSSPKLSFSLCSHQYSPEQHGNCRGIDACCQLFFVTRVEVKREIERHCCDLPSFYSLARALPLKSAGRVGSAAR
jgi:hypothetical protein